jgi:hypothetical protein
MPNPLPPAAIFNIKVLLLIPSDFLTSIQDEEGLTTLHHVIIGGRSTTLEKILKIPGVDPTVTDFNGNTGTKFLFASFRYSYHPFLIPQN